MSEELINELTHKITLWGLFKLSGPIGMALVFLSAIILITGFIVFCVSKQKHNFALWLMSVSMKFSMISAGCYFLMGLVKIGNMYGDVTVIPIQLLFNLFNEVCIGPMFLFVVALLAFSIKSILQLKTNTICFILTPTEM